MANLDSFISCIEKQQKVKQLFSACNSPQQKYEKIIEIGRTLPSYPAQLKSLDNLVRGCQSTMYLYAECHDGKVHFQAFSEALISAGLAALLIAVYNDEPPEAILSCPPTFLEEIGIHGSLSPSRSNGLASLFQSMKIQALNFLVKSSRA
jgi:cysteine desulfuration protein SufE